jgi:hypothetical protein
VISGNSSNRTKMRFALKLGDEEILGMFVVNLLSS